METSIRTSAEKNTSKLQQCQVNFACFFDHEEIVYHQYAPRGQMINEKYYVEILKSLPNAIERKLRLGECTSTLCNNFSTKPMSYSCVKLRGVLAQPLRTCGSRDLKCRSKDDDSTKKTRMKLTRIALITIPKTVFRDCFRKWKHQWKRIFQPNPNNFERCRQPVQDK